jgi:mRNA-degrading endonuclease toxin of MazEF toxin-antitoxin module
MVDKLSAVSHHRIRKRVGTLSDAQMEVVDRAIRMWLDLLP